MELDLTVDGSKAFAELQNGLPADDERFQSAFNTGPKTENYSRSKPSMAQKRPKQFFSFKSDDDQQLHLHLWLAFALTRRKSLL